MCDQAVRIRGRPLVRTTTHLAAQRRLWKILAVGVTGEAISLVAEAAEVFYGKTKVVGLVELSMPAPLHYAHYDGTSMF